MTIKENTSYLWGLWEPEPRVMKPGEEVTLDFIVPGLINDYDLEKIRVINGNTVQTIQEILCGGRSEEEVIETRYREAINDPTKPYTVNIGWGVYKANYTWEPNPEEPREIVLPPGKFVKIRKR